MRIVAGLTALVLAACSAGPEAGPEDGSEPVVIEPVAQALQPLIDDGELAGVAVAVWQDDALIGRWGQGVRDLESGAPMRADTIVRIYSMTKPVTAVAMMQLYEQGLWHPDDPVAAYLPELADVGVFRGLDAEGEPVITPPVRSPTMAQLMTHTAGFSYGFLGGWVDDRYREANLWASPSSDDFIETMASLPLNAEPGSEWRYSVSMDLQGVIIERLSGQSLSDYMRDHIFTPLAMADTGFSVDPAGADRLATNYDWRDGRLQPENTSDGLFIDPFTEPGFAWGGGGLFSTADDFLRFGRMLLGGGELDGVRVLTEASVETIMTNQISHAVAAGGFGIGFQQIRPGYQYGYNGVVVTDPRLGGVAVGEGTYLWDGRAMTWFWVDPAHDIVFVGMVQRNAGPGMPELQPLTQRAMQAAFYPAGD
ncbi:serine hydrolase domain-containing protein [Maricaulis sp.]|uniref:serine hydrolase domain-containing protein n=1 Tax=Maricaulis sp. TaxID=1486257 RepID=UPI0025BD77FE|nr:serine hydrolase domain-containing protein [Maricaulis sp.]